jgi:hypothetical protein
MGTCRANIDLDKTFQLAGLIAAVLLLPLVMAWGLLLPLRGIRRRLDRLITLMESGRPGTSAVPADYSQEERVSRALRNPRRTVVRQPGRIATLQMRVQFLSERRRLRVVTLKRAAWVRMGEDFGGGVGARE